MQKLKLAQHEYEEGHQVCRKKAKVLQIELNDICIKYKELVHMGCWANPVNQASFDISPIWISIISKEAGKLQSNLIQHSSMILHNSYDSFYLF
jgi:hypothetical protein